MCGHGNSELIGPTQTWKSTHVAPNHPNHPVIDMNERRSAHVAKSVLFRFIFPNDNELGDPSVCRHVCIPVGPRPEGTNRADVRKRWRQLLALMG